MGVLNSHHVWCVYVLSDYIFFFNKLKTILTAGKSKLQVI